MLQLYIPILRCLPLLRDVANRGFVRLFTGLLRTGPIFACHVQPGWESLGMPKGDASTERGMMYQTLGIYVGFTMEKTTLNQV